MIYCVIPQELEAELYDKLVEHYKDKNGYGPPVGEQRTIRDRRRAHPGTFPETDPPEAG